LSYFHLTTDRTKINSARSNSDVFISSQNSDYKYRKVKKLNNKFVTAEDWK